MSDSQKPQNSAHATDKLIVEGFTPVAGDGLIYDGEKWRRIYPNTPAIVLAGQLLENEKLQRENERLWTVLDAIEGINNEDYKTGGFLTGEVPANWAELALADAKTLARAELEDHQHKDSDNA